MKNRFALIYELLIWLLYVCLYKYSYFLDRTSVSHQSTDLFPHLQLMLFALLMTVYIVPFYRWIAPALLKKKRYAWFLLSLITYFGVVGKLSNFLVALVCRQLNPDASLAAFYQKMYEIASLRLHSIGGWDPNTLFTDILACLSLFFTRFAFDSIANQYRIENHNLKLQMEALKVQLQPHFLFNTLNSIYGMSMMKRKEAPEMILRLSDMMRYVLYDCKQDKVALHKDVEFLQNYLEMEKVRYPNANIDFEFKDLDEQLKIAPMLFIQFLENSFKHGAARVQDQSFIKGYLKLERHQLIFSLSNDVMKQLTSEDKYGGVGLTNAKQRLELYYPNQHELEISHNSNIFTVNLTLKTN